MGEVPLVRESELAREMREKPLSFEVLSLIADSDQPLQPTAVAKTLGRKLPSISRTLSFLVKSGLVQCKVEGRTRLYTIVASDRKRIESLIKERAGSLPDEFTRRGYIMNRLESAITQLIETHLEGYTIESSQDIGDTMMRRRGAVPDIFVRKGNRRIGIELKMGSPGLRRMDMLIKVFHLASVLDYGEIQGLVLIVFGEMPTRAKEALEDVKREKGTKFQIVQLDRIPARIGESGAVAIEGDALTDTLLPALTEALEAIQ
jgi:DNA-binding MarR family transcriptional regulator